MTKFIGPIPERILRMMPKEERAPMGKAGMTLPEIAAKARVQSERDLQNIICQWLALQSIETLRPRMDKKTGIKIGWPDITCAVNSIPLALEVKFADGKCDEDQLRVHERMQRNGWRVYVVRSLDEVMEIVKPLLAREGM